IVIGESAYSHERRGIDQKTAAIRGTQAVYVPVVFGVVTTMAAFLPLILVPGRMGQFFGSLGATAILCLIFSLVESQLILPAHLAHRRSESRGGHPNPLVARWQHLQGAMGAGLEHFGNERYGRALRRALHWRYATLSIAIGVLILSFSLLASGRLRYQFFPAVEGDTIHAALTMPRGIPVARTEKAVRQIEAAAAVLIAEMDAEREGPSIVLRQLSSIGKLQARQGPPTTHVAVGGSHLGEVTLELLPGHERDISAYEVVRRWREKVGNIPDAEELIFIADAFSAGMALNVELRGGDRESLSAAALEVQREFQGYAGVYDVANSFRQGKQEVKLAVRPEARSLGISLGELARQVRQAFYGEEVQRIQRGRDDVRVMLRYPESERRSLGFLEEMRIRAADGTEVPFSAVAEAELGRGFATIHRTDRKRVVSVTAEVDRAVTTPERVLARVEEDLPAILARYPGVQYSLEGEQREQKIAAEGLVRGTVLALMIIYALLAVPLGSYVQPLIIMSVIPFGTVGALLGHWIMNWDLVFFSMLGIVALAGVVVNASLVLVHFVNRERDSGASIEEAVFSAGIARFRPIFLTSATTFLGLVPLMFEGNIQARMMVPMAISLAYGVLFSSVVTLFLVPSLYLILEDLRSALSQRMGAAPASREVGPEIEGTRAAGSPPGFSTRA
ncbi:MAG: efflux RND transporter permease subunit, partial [Myxococcota bacterium]